MMNTKKTHQWGGLFGVYIMAENQELERGIIPAGTRIKLYEGSITLLNDVTVNANQEWIDRAIKDQADYLNGIGRTGSMPSSQY